MGAVIMGKKPDTPSQPAAPPAAGGFNGPAAAGNNANCTGSWNPAPDDAPTKGSPGANSSAVGAAGVPGTQGDNGVYLSVVVSEFIDGITFILEGGNGGQGADGGKGGSGQDGGPGGNGMGCEPHANGGNGGNGAKGGRAGDGGKGGNGGTLHILYHAPIKSSDLKFVAQGTHGHGGPPGNPGPGGGGGAGGFQGGFTDEEKAGGGDTGVPGDSGNPGPEGDADYSYSMYEL